MRVVYVYDGDWPRGATRVVKETRSLARAGHEVILVCRNTTRDPRSERNEWMRIERLPSVGWAPLNYALNFPLFVSPVWLWTVWRAVRRYRADCIVVADLPLAPTAAWVGRAAGIPTHFDMAEIYPEFLRSRWLVDRMRWSDRLVRNPAAAEQLERYVLPRIDKVFVVTEESGQRLQRLGVPDQRIVVVGNTPEDPEALAQPAAPRPPELARLGDRPVVLFVGILIADRGVKEAVDAMALVRRQVPGAALVVVGDGTDRARIEATIDQLGLRDHVVMAGWKQHGELAAYYAHAHVGLLPFLDSPHIRLTLANKLFDYMAAGLPAIAVDVPPMRRIIEETDCGVLYPPDSVPGLAGAITGLLTDPERRRRLGQHGQHWVQTKYHWAEDERRFLAAFMPS